MHFSSFCFGVLLLIFCSFAASNAATEAINIDKKVELESMGRQLVEQGRTLVHHAVKRFMIILPAIFFKLGIAFTLLLVVTLVAVNNGFIGFLLLVVGLSSVLARLQETRRPTSIAVPYISPPYHHGWDRSDSNSDAGDNSQVPSQAVTKMSYAGYGGQSQQYSPQLMSYYARYGASTATRP